MTNYSSIVKLIASPSNPQLHKLEDFVFNHPDGNFFQSSHAYLAYKSAKNYEPILLVAERHNEIIGSLIALLIKDGGSIKSIFSRRCIIWGGPIVNDNNESICFDILYKLDETISKKAIYTQIRNLKCYLPEEKSVFSENGYKYSTHLDILHDLTKPIQAQWENIHSGRRKNIQRAIKKGLVFREILNKSEFEQAYITVRRTYQRIKLPLADKSLFEAFNNNLTQLGIFKIFVAVLNDTIISSRMVLCYRSTIYDWYAGSDNNQLDKYPNDFMPWKVIEWGTQNGFNCFDFGGAGKPNLHYGVRDFKLKYGGGLVEFGRFEKKNNKMLFYVGKLGIKLQKLLGY